MRVLWIEDFGSGAVPESIVDRVFSGVLPEECRESLAETQGRDSVNSRPQGYNGWRNWHDKQTIDGDCEIDIYRSAKDIDDLVSSGYLVDRYDAILLDVNLENDFFETATELNPEEGGFRLYNKLVRAGFPSDRIALLTAHNSETATTDFLNGCSRYGHEELRAFGKSNQDAGTWVKNLANANSRFLHLRRGVLDGIEFAEGLLSEHGDSAIRLNRYIGKNGNISFDQALDHLYSIRHVIPLRVSGAEIDLQLRGVRYLLGCEWDRANPGFGSDFYYQALGWVMKCLRNWSSHGHLLDRASVGDIAFLALAAFRSSFLVPGNAGSQLRSYENWLLSAMGPERTDFAALSRRLTNSYLDARRLLRKLVGSPSRLRKDGQSVLLQDRQTFHEIVNELAIAAAPPPNFDFPFALREIFVHVALSPTYPSIRDDDAANMQNVEAAYSTASIARMATLPEWVKPTWTRL